jgi:hypothetical protein
MLVAFAWQTYLLGFVSGIILLGALLGALGQIGRTWTSLRQWFRPAPPRLELESSGGSYSHERDPATGEITWVNVCPGFSLLNNEPTTVYDVTAGIIDPASGDRIAHPQRLPHIKAETPFGFGSADVFQIPSDWLAGYTGEEPFQQVLYYVRVTDANERKWEGTFDPREPVACLRFRRV